MIEKSDFTQHFNAVLSECELGEFVTDEFITKFYDLMCFLLESNEKMNLTAITEPYDIIVKHFADSLKIVKYIPSGAKVLDVGCGGGFPSLPIAIVRPDITLHSLDSTEKKLLFVSQAAGKLGITNLTTIKARAEELARTEKHREKYDFVCARGVSRLNVLAELCIPFVRVGGRFGAMKAADTEAEMKEAKNAFATLSSTVESVFEFSLLGAARTIILIKKNGKTPPQYPREYNKIIKNPL